MKEMADFETICSHFKSNNLPYFTFYSKSQKHIKAAIQHLPFTTPAENISDGLVDTGFDIISIKQMSATHQSPAEGTSTVNLPLFLITLLRTSKTQEIFRLRSICHIAIRAEAYKTQTGLTQCYNCQKFGHVWANCKQPLRFMWCGGGHLHKECLEKGNAASIPTCCNYKLVDREEPHPSSIEAAAIPRTRYEKEYIGKSVLFQPHHPRTVLCSDAVQLHTATVAALSAPSCTGLPCHSETNECLASLEAQPASTKSVSSDS
jgi:hypothetical protein